jgi:DNA invertase Pin-like site-specific DNA recombinase
MVEGTVVIGYIRVSTEEQARSGAGLDAQEAAIREGCERRQWTLLRVERDTVSGATPAARRPGPGRAPQHTGELGGVRSPRRQ